MSAKAAEAPVRGTTRVTEPVRRALNAEGWRGMSVRLGLVGLVALLAALVHIPRPPTLCPLRAFTGVPCPICGSTTAAVELGAGDPVGALRANPVAVLLGTLWILGPLGISRWWWGLAGSRRLTAVFALLGIAWVWQLFRYGLL